jgi:hypothetical protein
MRHQTGIVLIVILAVCGIIAIAGGRHLHEVPAYPVVALYDPPMTPSASNDGADVHPQGATFTQE